MRQVLVNQDAHWSAHYRAHLSAAIACSRGQTNTAEKLVERVAA